MALFTGTGGGDVANAQNGVLTGFTGGSVGELQDALPDLFRGLGGDDDIRGGDSSDAIFGGLGLDALRGGGGDDTFNYESNAEIGADTINGGDGEDGIRITFTGIADFKAANIVFTETLVMEGSAHDLRFNASQVSATRLAEIFLIVGDDSGVDIVRFENASNLNLSAFRFDFWQPEQDFIEISGNNNSGALVGTAMTDRINAAGGDDAIRGGLGGDLLLGEDGNDIFMYGGNDEIVGDTIVGGALVDTLELGFAGLADFTQAVFSSGSGPSIERLNLVGGNLDVRFDAAQLAPDKIAGNLQILNSNSSPDTVRFINASILDLSALQFTAWDQSTDIIIATAGGSDSLITGSGVRDQIAGGAGFDTALGGGGDDALLSSAGGDTLRGEAGNDRLVYSSAAHIIDDTIDGGADSDTLRVDFTGVADFRNAVIDSAGTPSIERLELAGAGHDIRFNGSQVGATGLAQNLAIQGDAAGADIITFNGDDAFSAEFFTFTAWDQAADRLVINGTGGVDTLTGSSFADTIHGEGGVDTLRGGPGADILRGGDGDDVFVYGSFLEAVNELIIDGGAGVDTLRVTFDGVASFASAAIASTKGASIERLETTGGGFHSVSFDASDIGPSGLAANLAISGDSAGTDSIGFTNASSIDLSQLQFIVWDQAIDSISVNGTAGPDTHIGSSARDSLRGREGADTLRGGAGDDTFQYANASSGELAGDTIDGGTGVDQLAMGRGLWDFTTATIASSGGNSIERLNLNGSNTDPSATGRDIRFNASQVSATGIAENLAIIGSGDVDRVTFQNAATFSAALFTFTAWDQAADRLLINGTATNNTLTGSSVADTLSGGLGADTLIGGLGDDLIDGGGGLDTADFSGVATGVTVFLAGASDGFAIFTGSAEQDVLRGIENLTGGAGKEALVGDGFANILIGGGDGDFLFSTGFNPDGTLKANAGDDTLNGDAGNDGLFAGDGNDTLNGGAHFDGFVGGGGNDTLDGGGGGDFLFGGAFSAAGARLANSGADTLLGGDGNDGLYGFDGADNIFGGDGDDYIEGGDGVDVINGNAGSDFVLGEGGADTILGGGGFDYLYGGADADQFFFRKGDSADWILDFKASEGDRIVFDGFGFANFAAIPFVDLSSGSNLAVQVTVFNAANSTFDQLTIFGASLAQLNSSNVASI